MDTRRVLERSRKMDVNCDVIIGDVIVEIICGSFIIFVLDSTK